MPGRFTHLETVLDRAQLARNQPHIRLAQGQRFGLQTHIDIGRTRLQQHIPVPTLTSDWRVALTDSSAIFTLSSPRPQSYKDMVALICNEVATAIEVFEKKDVGTPVPASGRTPVFLRLAELDTE